MTCYLKESDGPKSAFWNTNSLKNCAIIKMMENKTNFEKSRGDSKSKSKVSIEEKIIEIFEILQQSQLKNNGRGRNKLLLFKFQNRHLIERNAKNKQDKNSDCILPYLPAREIAAGINAGASQGKGISSCVVLEWLTRTFKEFKMKTFNFKGLMVPVFTAFNEDK